MAQLHSKIAEPNFQKQAADVQKNTNQGVILVVDDSRLHLVNTATHLKKAGYQVFEATDGLQAILKAKQHKPDLILSDYIMPKMDGLELAKAIKSDPMFSNCYFILFTGDRNQEERNHEYNGIVDAVLQKPIPAKDLLAHINSVMKLKRLRAEMKSLDT